MMENLDQMSSDPTTEAPDEDEEGTTTRTKEPKKTKTKEPKSSKDSTEPTTKKQTTKAPKE
jgi:hypothetical protein